MRERETYVVEELVEVLVAKMVQRRILTVQTRERQLPLRVLPIHQSLLRSTRALRSGQVRRAEALRHARPDEVALLADLLGVVEPEDVVVAEDHSKARAKSLRFAGEDAFAVDDLKKRFRSD